MVVPDEAAHTTKQANLAPFVQKILMEKIFDTATTDSLKNQMVNQMIGFLYPS